MSTLRSVDRSALTHSKDRSAVAPSKDRASLCSFTFADGRQCRTPRCPVHPHLCYNHARKEAQARAADEIGRDISYILSARYLSACDLSTALGRLFSAVVQGQIKPKTATALAYLGQTLVQSIQLAENEYTNAFGTDSWRKTIHSSVLANRDPAPQPQLASPAPPKEPLPPTAAAFVESTLTKLYENQASDEGSES
jgi:hypothetical protein